MTVNFGIIYYKKSIDNITRHTYLHSYYKEQQHQLSEYTHKTLLANYIQHINKK